MNDLFFIMEAVSCERIKVDLDVKRTKVFIWFWQRLPCDSGHVTLAACSLLVSYL